MATGSYLYYNDAPTGVEFLFFGYGATSFICGMDALLGNSSNVQDLNNVLTLELNFWVLDGRDSWEYYDSTKEVGFISYGTYSQIDETYAPYYIADPNVSGGADVPSISFSLNMEISASYLTINWAGDSYPEYGYFYVYSGSDTFSYMWDGEKISKYPTGGAWSSSQLSFIQDSLPGRMIKINSFVFGNEITLTGSAMRSAKIVNEVSLDGETLPASTLTFTFESDDGEVPFIYGGGIQAYGKTLSGNTELIGTYYIDTITRKTTTQFTIEAVDAVGVLASKTLSWAYPTRYSYSFDTSSSYTHLQDIGLTGDFSVDISGADNTLIYTSLCATLVRDRSTRDWLRDILMGLNLVCTTDGTNVLRLFTLKEDGDITVIDDSRIYTGNTLNEKDACTMTAVEGNEYLPYSFVSSAGAAYHSVSQLTYGGTSFAHVQSYTTYDGTTYILWGSTIGTAATPDIECTGCYGLMPTPGAYNGSTITSTSPRQSPVYFDQRAAKSLYDFYQRTKTADLKIVWDGERLCDLVTVPDPYGNTLTGHIQKMTFTLSNITAAEIEVLGLAGQ